MNAMFEFNVTPVDHLADDAWAVAWSYRELDRSR